LKLHRLPGPLSVDRTDQRKGSVCWRPSVVAKTDFRWYVQKRTPATAPWGTLLACPSHYRVAGWFLRMTKVIAQRSADLPRKSC
jgi:hypothetical protein